MMDRSHKKELIQKFIEVSNLEHPEAKRIMKQTNYDLNRALEQVLEKNKKQSSPKKQSKSKAKEKSKQPQKSGKADSVRSIESVDLTQQKPGRKEGNHISKLDLEKLSDEKGRQNFRKTYFVKKSDKPKKKGKGGKGKGDEGEQSQTFRQKLEDYLNQPVRIDFYDETNDLLQVHWNTRKFIAVHCLNLKPVQKPFEIQNSVIKFFLTDVYTSTKLCSIFNKQFLNYVVDPKMQQFELIPQFHDLINAETDINTIVILRINERTKLLTRAYKLNMYECLKPANPELFRRSIWCMKKDINRVIDQEICSSLHHNPLGYLEKMKLDQDRQIRQEQENAYLSLKHEAEDNLRELRKNRVEKGEESDQEIQRMKQEVIKQVEEDIARQRALKRQSLTTYHISQLQDPLVLKLRMPNGREQTLALPKSERFAYIVDYIRSCEGDLGFDNELKRDFNVVQPWSTLKLASDTRQDEQLGQLFPGSSSQVLIVKELD